MNRIYFFFLAASAIQITSGCVTSSENSSLKVAATTSNSIVITQIDHIIISVSDPKTLHNFLTETFKLPVAWPVREYGQFASGGVFLGNVNLEILRIGTPQLSGTSTNAYFQGIAFRPTSLATAVPELDNRKISHGAPKPFNMSFSNGGSSLLWTVVYLNGFSGSNDMIFLCEYAFNIESQNATNLSALKSNGGGALGLQGASEIVVQSQESLAAAKHWNNLFSPVSAYGNQWSFGKGPNFHLISGKNDQIQALVLRVKSLTDARKFLLNNNLLGSKTEGSITIDPKKVNGLMISLVE